MLRSTPKRYPRKGQKQSRGLSSAISTRTPDQNNETRRSAALPFKLVLLLHLGAPGGPATQILEPRPGFAAAESSCSRTGLLQG